VISLENFLKVCHIPIMLDAQHTLQGLKEKRSEIERGFVDLEIEFNRIAQQKAELERQLSALDVVIELFDAKEEVAVNQKIEQDDSFDTETEMHTEERELDENTSQSDSVSENEFSHSEVSDELKVDEEPTFKLEPANNGHSEEVKMGRGYSRTAKMFFSDLPNEYTRHDLVDILTREHPELNGKVNDNTLTSISKMLVKSGLAEVKSKARGKVLQVYIKK